MQTPNIPPVAATELSDLLTDEQVGQLVGVSPKTLASWRSSGRYGLPFLKIGSRVRYSRAAVLAWLQSRQRTACNMPEVA